MPRKCKQLSREAREAIADSKWWEELCKYLPWRVHGFSWRRTCLYITAPVKSYGDPLADAVLIPIQNRGSAVQITGEQRNQILAAIKKRASGAISGQ